jgi:GntR family transcriptional repressor for pyruvate dehydrogenase complex
VLSNVELASGAGRRPGKSRRLVHELVGAISESIRNCAIRPGEKLPTESEIMAKHGLSRTVVREAISGLQAAGLVETRHGIGTFARASQPGLEFRIDPGTIVAVRDVLAMLELRISLETEAAGLAAARRTERQLDLMRDALGVFQASIESGGDTADPDFQFHLQVAYATANAYFADVMSHLGMATIPSSRVPAVEKAIDEVRVQYLRLVNQAHEGIYDAILRRDPEGARAAMRAHLTHSRDRLRRAQELAESQLK